MRWGVRFAIILTLGLVLFRPVLATEDAGTSGRDQGVIHIDKSPYAKLHSVPVRAVTIRDGFWGDRRRTAVVKSIPSIWNLIEEHGYVDNFRRISKGKSVPRKGPVFTDTDPYKWIEGVAMFLQSGDQPDLRAIAESAIDEILAVQEPSGYLATQFHGETRISGRLVSFKDRLTPETLDWGHEDYCLGHMLQSAIAYYRSTGERRYLDAARRFADFVAREFGPAKKPYLAGHPVVEMGLIELYRTTGDRKYLDLAGYILQGDPRIERAPHRIIYSFSGIPFTRRRQMEGHAVRAMYACAGATDYYLETGDQKYWQTLNHLWEDTVSTKMYVMGGLGARWEGEAFGEAYELPNARSYSETCAAIGGVMWNWRMLAATGDARFTDVLERMLYNAVNVGMSLDGKLYCYMNPLESQGKPEPNRHSDSGRTRNPWYDVLCCPPNIQRTLGALPGYMYSTSKDGVYVHLYDNSILDWHLADGLSLRVEQKTNYPWDGNVQLTVAPAKKVEFTLYVRIPGWASSAKVKANGKEIKEVKPGSYLAIRRKWAPGDQVHLAFDMTPQLVASHPRIYENAGKVALQRGPLVYCLEELDQAGASVRSVAIPAPKKGGPSFRVENRSDLLGGVRVIRVAGVTCEETWPVGALYRPAGQSRRRIGSPVDLTFIPYYAWSNREPSPMRVWVPYFAAGSQRSGN
jgi:DUF1680 family protein